MNRPGVRSDRLGPGEFVVLVCTERPGGSEMRKPWSALALAALLQSAVRERAGFPLPPCHARRAARDRRLDRHDRAHHRRRHAAASRPDRDRREHARRGRRTGVIRVARSAPDGYTHADRPVGHQCRQRRGARPADRSAQGPRAGGADLDPAVADRRPQGPAGQQSQGTGRLAEGQSRQGVGRQRRHRAARAMCSGRSSRTRSQAKFNFIPYRSAGPAHRRTWSAARST